VIPHLGPAVRSRRAAVREREELVVGRLQELAPRLDGEPDPDFRAATRARLVAMAAVRQPATAPAPPLKRLLTAPAAPARWRTRLTAGLAGAALTVTALAGLVAVSADAGPGDVLYGVKRGTEDTQLALAGDARRGQTLLDFAGTRLTELGALLRDGADPALVADTLATMDAQTRQGAAWESRRAVDGRDAATLERLAAWQGGQSARLGALRPEIPAAAGERYDASLSLLDRIGERVAGLAVSLQCATGPATNGADELGPVPAACVPPVAAAPGGSGGNGSTRGAPRVPAGTTATPPAGSGGTVPGGTVPGGTVPGAPGGGPAGSGGTGGTGGTPGRLPGGPDIPVEAPALPTKGLPLPPPSLVPTLPLPGDRESPRSPGLSICLPPVTVGTC
jgi:Domain of unknown function (DUF5667)